MPLKLIVVTKKLSIPIIVTIFLFLTLSIQSQLAIAYSPAGFQISSSGTIVQGQWLPRLHVEGKYIVDEDGNRVALRGAGMDYTAYDGQAREPFEHYIQTIKSKGLNTVRLAFNVPGQEPHLHTDFDFAKMDATLDACEANGLYAILDAHHYRDQMLDSAFRVVWKNLWVEIATMYAGRKCIAAYELANEACNYQDDLLPYYKEVMSAIKAVDPDAMFIVFELLNREKGMDKWHWQPYHVEQMPNTVFALHHWWIEYREDPTRYQDDFPFAECHASEYINFAIKFREYLGAPVWLDEFGAYDYDVTHAGMAEVKHIIEMAETQCLPWNVWMMEKPYNWDWLIPEPFITKYWGTPQPFEPIPFNILDKIVASSATFKQEPTYILLKDEGAYVTLQGPITVRIRYWEGLATTPDWSSEVTGTYNAMIHEIATFETIANVAGVTQNSTEIMSYSIP